ncbi:MAG: hypothetical protein AAF899_01590 [Pseudomonadota bacterium]
MTWLGYVAIAVAIGANVTANIALRHAVRAVEPGSPVAVALSLLANPLAWLGGISLALLLGSFLLAVRFLPLSLAYATVTASVIMLLSIFDAVIGDAALGPLRLAGIAAIVTGVVLLVTAGQGS